MNNPGLPIWLPHYESLTGPLAPSLRRLILAVSASSIDRLLKPARVRYGRGLSASRPGTLLRNQIPVRTEHWDVDRPGYFEADTVAHCGNSLAGDFLCSLTFTDIWSGWTHVRQLLGYERLASIDLLPLVNELYGSEWALLQNYFLPSMKLKTKEKVGARYRRKYEAPRTPCQRLLESPHVSKQAKLRLRHTFRQLNPFTLKKEIERKLKKVFALHRQLQARSEGGAWRDDGPNKDRKRPAFKVSEEARHQGLAP